MIRPNVSCTITEQKGTDVYGQAKLALPRKTRCNVVTLVVTSEKTSVRADSSGSRGNVDELVSLSKLLFLPRDDMGIGSKIEVSGVSLRVIGRQLRFTVSGKLDHIEVDCEVWA